MGQLGFFDADKRLAAISAKGDPLEMIDRVVPFESFRAEIEAVVLTPAEDKKSSAGRKPIDVIVMFRMLVLQSLYNLSDEQVEYQVSDRMSFTRFLRLGIEDRVTMRIDQEVLILDEAVSPKLFIKRDVIGRTAVANVNAANVIDPPGFLCASHKRQSRRSSNERDEFASPHVYPPRPEYRVG
jgi:hypothetical protein